MTKSSSSNPFRVQVQAKPASAPRPAWVPPAGNFADVPMLNNPGDVMPSVFNSGPGMMNVPFTFWGGSAILQDYSPLGAQLYYSGGHESSPGEANFQLSLICDFSSLRWSVANVPAVLNPANTFNAEGYAPDGSPYTPHSYLGLQEFPAAWGGGVRGSLMSFFWAGSPFANRINVLDVSKTQNGYSQFKTTQPENDDPSKIRFFQQQQGSNYPVTVIDRKQQGWWVTSNGESQYTLFVSKSGKISQFPALGGNSQDSSMFLCGSLNLLVVADGGYSSGDYAGKTYRTLYLRNVNTGKVTSTTTVGDVPGRTNGYDGGTNNYHRPNALGLQWVEELGCVVGLDSSTTPPTLMTLTPPAKDPDTSPWVWASVPLQHWSSDAGGQSTLQSPVNGYWSKFRWVPSLQAFVVGTAYNKKPQVISLS